MTRAFVFPGQGSQAVGMGVELGQAFGAAREVYQEVDEALGQKLSVLMAEGPESELVLTENAQPALMAVSMAMVRVLQVEGGLDLARFAAFVAGHSLGEYSALCAAGVFGVADAARLLKIRGKAMQKAAPLGEGAMAALIGLELEQVQEVAGKAAQGQVLAVANDNAPGQIVVSGARQAVERAVALAEERGARKSVMLPVSAPFHCPLMSPAAEAMAGALETVTFSAPTLPLMANVTAAPTSDPVEIKRLLVEQVTAMVRWRESVLAMKAAGVDTLVECGAGRVLSGLTRRIDRDLTAVALNAPSDVESFLKG